jgi:hypothetical protein
MSVAINAVAGVICRIAEIGPRPAAFTEKNKAGIKPALEFPRHFDSHESDIILRFQVAPESVHRRDDLIKRRGQVFVWLFINPAYFPGSNGTLVK